MNKTLARVNNCSPSFIHDVSTADRFCDAISLPRRFVILVLLRGCINELSGYESQRTQPQDLSDFHGR